jgi:hypothetical protein
MYINLAKILGSEEHTKKLTSVDPVFEFSSMELIIQLKKRKKRKMYINSVALKRLRRECIY